MAEAKYAEERRSELLRILASAGRIDAATVAAEFGVTSETVRKDLIALENTGLLRRVHGGAVPADSHLYEPTLEARIEFSAEKQRIAHKALEYIPNGGAALFDAGTTTHRLVQQLPTRRTSRPTSTHCRLRRHSYASRRCASNSSAA